MALNSFSLKHNLWLFTFLLLMTMKVWSSSFSTTSPETSQQEEAVAIATQELPLQGELQQGPDGFVYVKVPDQYVHRLFPLVKEPGFMIPRSIQRHTKVGAHISVFYKDEAQKIGPIHELGKIYSFTPERIRLVRNGRKEYIILEVKAPELEKLRAHYGLSPKLMDYEFHITLAEKDLHHFKRH